MEAQVQPIKPRARSAENKRFANDGSFESVELLLRKLALKCHKRLASMGLLDIQLEDVFQEMSMTYLMAKERWSPDRGVYFSTYLTTACYRNFETWIRKRMTERRHLGMVNFSSMSKVNDDGHVINMEELASAGNIFGEKYTMDETTPEGALMASQELAIHRENVQACIPHMTENAKKVMTEILMSEKTREAGQPLVKISDILRSVGANRNESARVRKELSIVFGVKL